MNTNSSDHSILNSDRNFWCIEESHQQTLNAQVPTTYTSGKKTAYTEDGKLKNVRKSNPKVGEIFLADSSEAINDQDDILNQGTATSSNTSVFTDSNVARFKSSYDVNKIKFEVSSKRKDSSSFKNQGSNKNIICRFYFKNGSCNYGKNCKFKHSRERTFVNKKTEFAVDDEKRDTVAEEVLKSLTNENVAEEQPKEESRNEKNQSKRNDNRRLPPRFTRKQDSSFKWANIKKDLPEYLMYKSSPQHEISVSSEDDASEDEAPMKYQENFGQNYNQVYGNKTRYNSNQSRICKYFQNGYCFKGNYCWFKHVKHINKNEREVNSEIKVADDDKGGINLVDVANDQHVHVNESKQEEYGKNIKKNNSFMKEKFNPLNRRKLQLKDASEEELKKLRETEIAQLKKRFPNHEVLDGKNNGTLFSIKFIPSDPDWPFEVNTVEMKVLLEEDYPQNICKIIIDEDERMPTMLIKHLNKSVKHWLTERHKTNSSEGYVELMFRSFLLWFDQNLENLFITGLQMAKKEIEAKALGIEFVPFEDLKPYQEKEHSVDTENNSDKNQLEQASEINNKNNEELKVSADNKEINSGKPPETVITNTPPKRGTEVKLRDFRLGENAGTLLCQKISLTFQCSRCKTRHEMSTPPNRNNALSCTKCHRNILICFQPSILHGYSATLGYLHLVDCLAVDIPLMECVFSVNCMNCSKQCRIDGVHYGQNHITWCLYCNSKMSVFADSVKFQQLQPSEQLGGLLHQMKLDKKEKKVKDPRIQEGKPLPSNGTCKHYKKSFRWLRFPCCGKAYPCDYCHNEVELDHEMKYATRMICGFCAKEQPYTATKPCIACSSDVTKKAGSHWEGGKGCRDRLKMNRGDRQKYVGASKTAPKKAQDSKE